MFTKRFFRFVVKRFFGRLIKDDLPLQDLEVELGEGTVHLKNIELETEVTLCCALTAHVPVRNSTTCWKLRPGPLRKVPSAKSKLKFLGKT